MTENYTTVLIEDDKGRITVPATIRKVVGNDEKTVYRLTYDSISHEITLVPIGKSDLK